jgi:hypothetical protein
MAGLIIHKPNARSYRVLIARVSRLMLPERLVFGLIRFLEYRDDDDVFPTLYRANTRKELLEAASHCGLRIERLLLVRRRPMFHFIFPICVLEMLLTRFLTRIGMEDFVAPVLLGVFRRASV